MKKRDVIRLLLSSAFRTAVMLASVAVMPGIASASVRSIEVEGLYSISREEFLMLLGLRTGDEIDPVKIRQGIKRAFLKGNFEDIRVIAADSEGSVIRVEIREREFIGSVKVIGNSYLSGRKIKTLFLLKEGQIMRHDLIEGAAAQLKSALSDLGFPGAGVEVVTEKTSPGKTTVILNINEGEPVIIQRLEVYGVPESEVRGVIKTYHGDIYNQEAIRKDIEAVNEHYITAGCLKPAVGYSFSDGTLSIEIRPGKKLVTEFEGNKVFSSRELLREMPFRAAGDIRDDLVDEARRRILSLYRAKGYLYAQAAPVKTDAGGDTLRLHFFIFEGEKVTLSSIGFSGISLKEADLKEVMTLKEGDAYRQDALSSDIDNLREFYYALGYIHVNVHEPVLEITDFKARAGITIEEGVQVVIDEILIEGVKAFPPERIEKAIGITKGSLYNDLDISNSRYKIIDVYTDEGFVDAGVDVKRDIRGGKASVKFIVSEGRRSFFGKTVITGNRTTRAEVIERELITRESEPFSQALLTRQRQKLYKLGLFADVSTETLDAQDDKRDVRINVKEGNAGAVEFGAGYGNYDGYRGFFDISYRNLFGMNRQASFRVEHSSLEDRFMLSYYEPWFLKRPLPFRTLLMKEEKTEKNIDTDEVNYKLSRYTASAGVEKELSSNIKGELYYEFSIVKTYDVRADIVLSKEDTGTLAVSGVSPGLIYDTRDNPFDPRKGLLAGVSMKVASGLLFSETDFVKMVANANLYRELSPRHVFAVSVRLGAAQGFGTTRELPLVERFFLGGRNTVRGYDQDTLGPKGADGTPTGGNAFFMSNIELRSYLGRGVGLVTFLDAGNVWVKTSDIDLDLKYTAGIGLRYNTPVGPLRIDYGYKLNREAGEGMGALHFSIGHAF